MQFTGSELIQKRNFYTQNLNFGFAFDCYVDNTSGRYDFGLSGTTGLLLNFTLLSGQMSLNGSFIHNYQPFERFSIEGQVTSGRYNVLKNGAPLVYGGAEPSGDFSYFYMKRSLPSMFADWNLFVSGQNTPQVTVDQLGYLLTSGQTGVTGYLHNNGTYPFRVFGSTATSSQGTLFNQLAATISGHGFSGFSLNDSSHFSSFNFSQPALINMATNFGDINVLFSVVDARSQSVFVYLQPVSDWSFNELNQLNRSIGYNNYSGGFQTNGFNTDLSISLTYVSQTGVFATTNVGELPYTGIGIGTFFQSGLYTGLFSGDATYNGQVGTFVTPFSSGGYAMGYATAFFSGTGIGIGTGISGVSGLSTGIITGLLIGFISGDQSGIFHFVGQPTGIGGAGMSLGGGSGVPTTIATGYIDVTNVVNGDQLYFGYDIDHAQTRVMFGPPINIVWSTPSALVSNIGDYADAYGINAILDGGGVIDLSAITGGIIGNTLTVRALSTNNGTLTGTNYSSGIRDYYSPQYLDVSYIGAIRLTGGSVGLLATGDIDFTDSIGFNDILYVHNPTGGYYVQTTYQDPVTFIQLLSGLSGFYGINGQISSNDNIVNLTSSVEGDAGNLSAIYIESSNPGITTGSNYLDIPGTLSEPGFIYAYTYNESIALTNGAGGGPPVGLVVPTVGVGIWTGGFINHFYTGNGTFSVLLEGVSTGTFYYTRTFTGTWDVLTGLTPNSLVSLINQGFNTDTVISGHATNLPPNSALNIQIVHDQNPFVTDTATLQISGANVLNPITQLLSN